LPALILLAAALLPGLARAHAARPAHAEWARWNLEPWLLGLLALSALAYAAGLRRLWRNAGAGRGVSRRQAGGSRSAGCCSWPRWCRRSIRSGRNCSPSTWCSTRS